MQLEHFDVIVQHLDEALTAYGASREDIHTVLDNVATFKEAILYKQRKFLYPSLTFLLCALCVSVVKFFLPQRHKEKEFHA
ncbi:hypothetical protein CAL7716_035610 [Calothrix sp. PCC 7716]|nr:hypothetical protein CAL7716_035610 [Calothrix sp. PCC 7716]